MLTINLKSDYTENQLRSEIFAHYGKNKHTQKYADICCSNMNNKKSATTENHHVFLIKIFGNNTITVHLDILDHFRAHYYLYKGYKEVENYDKRSMNKIASSVTSFLRNTENRRIKLSTLNESNLIEYFKLGEEARLINKTKNVGCTHYTNLETNKIVFTNSKPEGDEWVNGNLHGRGFYYHNQETNHIIHLRKDELPPEGYISGSGIKPNAGAHWFVNESTKEYILSKEHPGEGWCAGGPNEGMRYYKNEQGDLKKFKHGEQPEGYSEFQHNLGKFLITDLSTKISSFKTEEEISKMDNYIFGNPEDYITHNKNKKLVKILATGIWTYINLCDFDQEKMIFGNSLVGCVCMKNPNETEYKYFPSESDAPEGWVRGVIRETSLKGTIKAYNPNTLIVKFFANEMEIPEGWVRGSINDRTWINKEGVDYYSAPEDLDKYMGCGWSLGRSRMKDNKLMLGKHHIHNPTTKEKKTINDGEILPEGWVRGLLKKDTTSNTKGKLWVKNLDENKAYYVNGLSDLFPGNWIRKYLKFAIDGDTLYFDKKTKNVGKTENENTVPFTLNFDVKIKREDGVVVYYYDFELDRT